MVALMLPSSNSSGMIIQRKELTLNKGAFHAVMLPKLKGSNKAALADLSRRM